MLKTLTLTTALLSAGAASAQEDDWRYKATIYLWVPSMSTSVDTLNFGTISGEMSQSDVLSNLDMAFMGTFAAQHGNWGFVGDLLYTDLSTTQSTPLDLFDSASFRLDMTALSAYALYRVTNDPNIQLDLGAGFRNFDLNFEASLNAGLVPTKAASLGKSWTDPLIAARLTVPIDDKWFFNGFADWGGTSSTDQTYQIYAGVGYNFDEAWSMQFGYRYMDIKQEVDAGDLNIGLSGALLGVSYSF